MIGLPSLGQDKPGPPPAASISWPRRAALAWLAAALVVALALGAGAGCAPGAGLPAASGDAGGAGDAASGPAVLRVVPEAPLAIAPEPVWTPAGPPGLRFLAALPGERAAVVRGQDLMTVAPAAVASLGGDAGAVHDLLVIGRGLSPGADGAGGILVGGERGLFALLAGGPAGTLLERSPLDRAAGGPIAGPVRRLLDIGGNGAPRVFVVTAAGLFLWQAGKLGAVTLEGVAAADLARARYAARADAAGGASSPAGALFVAAPEVAGVWMLTRGPGGALASQVLPLDAPPRDLVTDNAGTLWLATADGFLMSIAAGGERTLRALPDPAAGESAGRGEVTALWSDPSAASLWIEVRSRAARTSALDAGSGDAGVGAARASALWHQQGGAYRQLVGPDGTPRIWDAYRGDGGLVAADLSGPLLLAGSAGVARARPETAITLGGLGPILSAPQPVDVGAPHPASVVSLTADLDGKAQWTDLGTSKVVLDPWSLPPNPDGERPPHTLTVTVRYRDGTSLRTQATITLGSPVAPTWAGAIAPLYAARCARCHGLGGSGHRMDTLERWRAQIDTIVSAVSDRRMPLPPNPSLSGIETVTLRGWKESGLLP